MQGTHTHQLTHSRLLHLSVPDASIRKGWLHDPNDYTTCCPYADCAPRRRRGGRGSAESDTKDSDSGGGGSSDHGAGGGGSGSGSAPAKPRVRFVARFSVVSKAPYWEGSTGNCTASGGQRGRVDSHGCVTLTPCLSHVCVNVVVLWCAGPGTPLFCEYLPPWVLLKDLQKTLALRGERALTSANFRARSPTVFWNLVLLLHCC